MPICRTSKLCLVCGRLMKWQRASRRFCGAACKQSFYRQRKSGRVRHRRAMPRVAFGHVVRQKYAATVLGDAALGNATVRPITWQAAKEIITLYEPMLNGGLAYGLFIDGTLAGAVVFGPEPAANLRVWDRYDWTDKIICLQRGACAPWAPRNTASKLIRRAMRLLPQRYKVVTALSDVTLGERGAIYRAAGFHSVGVMATGGRRVLVRYRGKWLSERSARRHFGTASARQLAKLGFKVETVPRRARYFAFRGTRREQRDLCAQMQTLAAMPVPSGLRTAPPTPQLRPDRRRAF